MYVFIYLFILFFSLSTELITMHSGIALSEEADKVLEWSKC